jgi:hypothetical protein
MRPHPLTGRTHDCTFLPGPFSAYTRRSFWPCTCYTINVELLLELAREREGQDVGWDEWGAHTIEVRGGGMYLANLGLWVSTILHRVRRADTTSSTYLQDIRL